MSLNDKIVLCELLGLLGLFIMVMPISLGWWDN